MIGFNRKPRDQAIKADAGKPRLSLVPPAIIVEIARVREYGVGKYGSNESWREVDRQRYIDACYRHFIKFVADPDAWSSSAAIAERPDPGGVDEESGLPHLSHVACNVAFLCEMMGEGL